MKFCVKEFLFVNLDFEKGCKNEFEDHAADSKIGSPLKIDFEPIGLTSPTRQPESLIHIKCELNLYVVPEKTYNR